MKILGYIPARGGSKGVPGKNIKLLGGVPLMAHAIRTARDSGVVDRLWVSTENAATAAVAKDWGVEVPWLRPAELAQDDSALPDALHYDLSRLDRELGYKPDAVLILQTTSPFRSTATIRRAVELFVKHNEETIVSVAETHAHPYWCYRIDAAGEVMTPFVPDIETPPTRQELPAAFVLDGSIFLISTELFLKNSSFRGGKDHPMVVPREEALDIDTPLDWETAAAFWEARQAQAAPAAKNVFIIAEAGVNHNGRLDLALSLVNAAKEAGADAVKFQTFEADALVSAGAQKAEYQKAAVPDGDSQREMIRGLQLDEAAHRRIQEHCRERGIQFLSTPFDEASADLLARLDVPLFKLSSGDLTNKPLLEHVARKGRPLIVSTGMSTLAEVAQAVGWIRAVSSAPLTLLHCLSEYPAPAEQVNLSAMRTLREALQIPVGYSDHTIGIEIAVAAAALGACVIEKHLTLDRDMPGPDHRASLEPGEFAAMTAAIRRVTSAMGDGVKAVAPCEAGNRIAARRSVVASRSLPQNHVLARADLAVKRPGDGIPPGMIDSLVGKKLRRAVPQDEALTWEALA